MQQPTEAGMTDVLRRSRIFGKNGRAIIVALDHIASGLMRGWEYPEETLEKILDECPDAILANFGILKRFGHLLSEQVSTILRLDGGPTDLVESWPHLSDWKALYTVKDALNLGVDGVMATLYVGSHLEVVSMEIVAKVASECLGYEIPCAFHAVPVEGPAIKNIYDPDIISFAARLAAELGADFVNTYYPRDPTNLRLVTSRCPVPVLISGGAKLESEYELFKIVTGMLAGGGSGLFIGRNVWQHRNPPLILKSLKRIIHQNATIDEVLEDFLTAPRAQTKNRRKSVQSQGFTSSP